MTGKVYSCQFHKRFFICKVKQGRLITAPQAPRSFSHWRSHGNAFLINAFSCERMCRECDAQWTARRMRSKPRTSNIHPYDSYRLKSCSLVKLVVSHLFIKNWKHTKRCVFDFFISSRTEVRDELSSSRTSFFPLHEGRGSRNLLPSMQDGCFLPLQAMRAQYQDG